MRRWALLISGALSLGTTACSSCGNEKTETGAVTPEPTTPSAPPTATPRRAHLPGPAGKVLTAALSLSLSDEQKTKLEDVDKPVSAPPDPAAQEAQRAASKALQTELTAQVRAGSIDAAKLEPLYDAVEKSSQPRLDLEAQAIAAVHAALTPEQRKAISDDLKTKQAAQQEKLKEVRAKAAAASADAGRPPRIAPEYARYTRSLELNDEQEKKVLAFGQREGGEESPQTVESRGHELALYEAFAKDDFDPKKLDLYNGKAARGPLEAASKVLAQLLPVLTAEQREKLALQLEKGPGAAMEGPGGLRRGLGNRLRPATDGKLEPRPLKLPPRPGDPHPH